MVVIDNRIERPRRTKLILATILAAALLGLAWFIYSSNETADAPAQSTTETRPNNAENTPPSPDGSVTEQGNETEDTTPSSSGTGNNTTLNPNPGVQ